MNLSQGRGIDPLRMYNTHLERPREREYKDFDLDFVVSMAEEDLLSY